MKLNNRGQITINSPTLLIQELLAPVFIGLMAKILGKNMQKAAFAAAERRKLPPEARKNPKIGHFHLLKVLLYQ